MIKKFIESSLIEWEGKISAVVVFSGCNFRCGFCHGSEFLLQSPPYISVDSILEKLEKKKKWLDGVVFSGGECTLSYREVMILAEQIKSLSIPIKIHTNGSNPALLKKLFNDNCFSCLALDYKSLLNKDIEKIIGIQCTAELLNNIKESFDLAKSLSNSGFSVEYHTTLIPKYITLDYFIKMSNELDDKNGLWILQQYNNDNALSDEFKKIEPYKLSQLDDFEIEAKKNHNNVLMRK